MEEMLEKIMQRLANLEEYAIKGTKNVLNLEEAALLLGKKKETVRRLMQKHIIPYYKPTRNDLYFKRSELEDYMLQNRCKTDEEVEQEAIKYCLTHKLKK